LRILRLLDDESFGVNDALSDELAVGVGGGVVAEVTGAFTHPIDDDRALFAAIGDDLAKGRLQASPRRWGHRKPGQSALAWRARSWDKYVYAQTIVTRP